MGTYIICGILVIVVVAALLGSKKHFKGEGGCCGGGGGLRSCSGLSGCSRLCSQCQGKLQEGRSDRKTRRGHPRRGTARGCGEAGI